MRTIAIVNQKGGCGKTTTAINLAAVFAARGVRTLLVDIDPQSHCAAGLGVPESSIEMGVGDALLADHDRPQALAGLLWEVARNLHLAPSTTRLAALEAPGGGLHQLPDRDRRLESLLHAFHGRFDLCLIDCPPTIGLLTFSALRAAREVLVPVETGYFSLKGAHKQWKTIQSTIDHLGRPIACHMLPTLHDPGSTVACDVLVALHRDFAGQIVPTVIREHESLREAASYGQPIVEYAPESEAARDFESLAEWLEEHAVRGPEIEIVHPMSEWGVETRQDPRTGTCDGVHPSHHPASAEARKLESGSRAAEMAQRVRRLAIRYETKASAAEPHEPEQVASAVVDAPASYRKSEVSNPQSDISNLKSEISAITSELSDSNSHPTDTLAHVFGVTQVGRSVLFVQPAGDMRSMAVAGEFNDWSASDTPLRYNADVGTFEALVEVPPGIYRYRLIVDGQWTPDRYNPRLVPSTNDVADMDSLLVVKWDGEVER